MEIKERMKYFYEQVSSNNLADEMCNYISQDCTIRVGEQIIPIGLDGMIKHNSDVRKTYPDFKMKVLHQFYDNNYLVTEFVMQGTHEGEWLGMKPTGKKLTFTGVNIDKIQDGKIIEHSGAMNTFETLYKENIIQPTP